MGIRYDRFPGEEGASESRVTDGLNDYDVVDLAAHDDGQRARPSEVVYGNEVAAPSPALSSGTSAFKAVDAGQTVNHPTEIFGAAQASPVVGDDWEFAAQAVDLCKVYGSQDTRVVALDNVSVGFVQGQFTAIMGPSGSGKSTLMHCMAGLDGFTSGSVFLGSTNLARLKDKELTALRRDRLGFIFQSFNLVPTLTAAENITLPLDIAGRKVDRAWYYEITDRLGLSGRLKHRPSELSGGQQQRVACARALVSRPAIIFGDEPTGNLDSNSGREVLEILRSAVDQLGQTVVIVTHDAKAASYADRVVFLADGRIVHDTWQPGIDGILATMAGIEDA